LVGVRKSSQIFMPGATSIDVVVWGGGSQLAVSAGSAVYHAAHPGQQLRRLFPAAAAVAADDAAEQLLLYGVPDLMYQGNLSCIEHVYKLFCPLIVHLKG
jgi:hypothetical protein